MKKKKQNKIKKPKINTFAMDPLPCLNNIRDQLLKAMKISHIEFFQNLSINAKRMCAKPGYVNNFITKAMGKEPITLKTMAELLHHLKIKKFSITLTCVDSKNREHAITSKTIVMEYPKHIKTTTGNKK